MSALPGSRQPNRDSSEEADLHSDLSRGIGANGEVQRIDSFPAGQNGYGTGELAIEKAGTVAPL